AVIPVTAAVEGVAAALGHERNLSSDAAPILSLVAAGEHLEFRDGVDADADVHTAVVAGIDVADAVNGELILRGARAVHRERVGAGAGTAHGVRSAGCERHARNK